MQLFQGLRIIDSKPALYIEEIDAAVISDLHLGIEVAGARSGAVMPRFQLEEMVEDLEEIQKDTGALRLVVDGDVKHSFGGKIEEESEEIERFLDKVSYIFDRVWLVKGNHDNALEYRVGDYKNVELKERFLEDGFLFVHGHEKIDDFEDVGTVVIGHEHPVLSLEDEVGVSEKVPCFLHGEMKNGCSIVVMPAYTEMAQGTAVNRVSGKDLLSPILREQVDVGELEAVAVDREAGVFEFPELSKI